MATRLYTHHAVEMAAVLIGIDDEEAAVLVEAIIAAVLERLAEKRPQLVVEDRSRIAKGT